MKKLDVPDSLHILGQKCKISTKDDWSWGMQTAEHMDSFGGNPAITNLQKKMHRKFLLATFTGVHHKSKSPLTTYMQISLKKHMPHCITALLRWMCCGPASVRAFACLGGGGGHPFGIRSLVLNQAFCTGSQLSG